MAGSAGGETAQTAFVCHPRSVEQPALAGQRWCTSKQTTAQRAQSLREHQTYISSQGANTVDKQDVGHCMCARDGSVSDGQQQGSNYC